MAPGISKYLFPPQRLSEYRLQNLGAPDTTKAHLNTGVKSEFFHLQEVQGISHLTHGAAAIQGFVGRRHRPALSLHMQIAVIAPNSAHQVLIIAVGSH